jgi:NADPH:quinone reductase
LRGARVIGTTSTEAKAQEALQAGADAVILYTQDIAREVKRLTNGQGVQVVYDGIGKDALEANLDSLARRGFLIIYGQTSGPNPPLDLGTLMGKGSLFVTRVWAVHYLSTQEERQRRIQDIFTWIEQGKLRIKIDRIFPLSEAAQAHSLIEQRQTNGKVLLIP